MRRFESPAHDEFWEVWIEDGRVLCHRFGRLGSRGLVGMERFPTDDDAMRQVELRIAERQAGGFAEANLAGPAGAAPSAADDEPTLAVRAGPRVDAVRRALVALEAVAGAAGRRSWQVAREVRRARRALRRLGEPGAALTAQLHALPPALQARVRGG